MKITIRVLPLFASLLGVLLAQPAFAHNYLPAATGGALTPIPNIDVSRAAYRELTSKGQVDVYEFSASKGQEIYVQMTVPLLEQERTFAPSILLLSTARGGADFETPALDKGVAFDPAHDVVDAVLQHGEGGEDVEPPLLAVRWDAGAPVAFNEPLTGTRYWIRQTLTVKAPADGTYRIGIFSNDGTTGKYVLATGKQEQFSAADIASFPGVRLAVRRFCEVPIWPDILAWSVLGAAALGAAGLGIYALFML